MILYSLIGYLPTDRWKATLVLTIPKILVGFAFNVFVNKYFPIEISKEVEILEKSTTLIDGVEKDITEFIQNNPFKVVISSSIFFSIFEEIVFRIPLMNSNVFFAIPLISFISSLSYNMFLELNEDKNKGSLYDKDSYKELRKYKYKNYLPPLIFLHVIVLVIYNLFKKSITNSSIENLAMTAMILTNSLSFALLHVNEYKVVNHITFIAMLLNQGIAGIIFGFLARKYGLRYSIMSHIMMNVAINVRDYLSGNFLYKKT